MPIKPLTPEIGSKRIRRVLLIGGPNTFKTTSIISTADKPLHILSYPGEKGSGVIPTNDPGVKGYVWEDDDPLAQKTYGQQIQDIEKNTWDILAGNNGPIETFCGDGLHKLASLYWNREYARLKSVYSDQIAAGKLSRDGQPLEEGLKLNAYGNENFGATKEIMAYISRVCQSNVHNVVFTCWEGVEVEEDTKGKHIFADLPGRLARRIVGEFGAVVFAEVGLPDPKGNVKATWQTRKQGKVWGVGIKVRPELAAKIPATVPQDLSALLKLLTEE